MIQLADSSVNHMYEVVALSVEDGAMRRLRALGMIEGTKIQVLNKKKNGTTIFKVRGTRLAVGSQLARGIDVKEVIDGGK